MDTPVSKSGTIPALPPSKLFFSGMDYPEGPARSNAVSARAIAVQKLHRRKDQLGLSLAHLRPADDMGLPMNSAEVLVAIADSLQREAHELAALMAMAHSRWAADNRVVPEFKGDSATQQPPAASSAGMAMMVKPTDIHFPANMAQAAAIGKVKRGQLNGMINPALRMGRS